MAPTVAGKKKYNNKRRRPAFITSAIFAGVVVFSAATAMTAMANPPAPVLPTPPKAADNPGELPGNPAGRSAMRARRRVLAGAGELRDDLTERDVYFNLRYYYVVYKNAAAVDCGIAKTKAVFSRIFLEGIHQYAPREKEAEEAKGAKGRRGYLKATVFFHGDAVTGLCAGRQVAATIALVRLTDGVWFSPDWRESLVKRQ